MKTVIKQRNQILLIFFILIVVLYAYFAVYKDSRSHLELTVDAIQEKVLTQTTTRLKIYSVDIDRLVISLNELLRTDPNRSEIEVLINRIVSSNPQIIDGINVVSTRGSQVFSSREGALNYSADALKDLPHGSFIVEYSQGRYFFSRISRVGGYVAVFYADFSKIFDDYFLKSVNNNFKYLNTDISFTIGFNDPESEITVAVDDQGSFYDRDLKKTYNNKIIEKFYISKFFTREINFYTKPVDIFFKTEIHTISEALKKALLILLLGLCAALLFINFIIAKDVTKPVMVLIKKMNDFRLGIENRSKLPYARKDVVGELMREFSNLYTDLRDKTNEAVGINKELELKGRYLTQKLYEMKKMRDLIVKSFTLSDSNALIKEFLQIIKDVFQSQYSALYRIVVEDNMSRLVMETDPNSKTESEIYDKIKPAVRKLFKDNVAVRYFSLDADGENSNIMIAQIKTNENILGCFVVVRKRGDFTKQEEDVAATFADQSAIIFENNRLYRQEMEKLKLEVEMSSAKEIQEVVINRHVETGNLAKVKTFYQPAVNIGGDWYDCIKIDDNKIAFMIADITGHGVASALVTVAFSTYFRIFSDLLGSDVFNKNSLSEIVAGLNRILISLSGGLKQATLAIGLYDSLEGKLEYISAGHNPSMLFSKEKKKLSSLQTKNMRLGDEANSEFVAKTLDISPGDILFLYTDGLIENKGRNGIDYGKKRLRKLIDNNLGVYDIYQTGDKLIADVSDECNFDALEDDITFMFVEIK